MGVEHLSIFVLQQVAECSVQNTGTACYQRGRVLAWLKTGTSGFDADELYSGCVREGVKDADGVAASTNAGDDYIRQSTLLRENLRACLVADDRLEVAHDARIGMRPYCRTDQVEGSFHVGYP